MSDYYKTDSRRITLREYWKITPSWKVLIPWFMGRLNLRMEFGSGFCIPETVKELEVLEAGFSPQARVKLQPLLDECQRLGFHSPRYYTFESLQRETRTSFIALLHRSGEFSVRLMHTVNTQTNPPVETQLAVLLSELHDGAFFFTSDQNAKFNKPPGITGTHLPGANLGKLFESHQQQLAQVHAGNPPQMTATVEAMDAVWNRYEKHSTDFGIKRGLYRKMSPEDVAREQQIVTQAQGLATAGDEHADVLMELSRLQNKKAGWGGAVIILLVTLAMFVGAGAQQWSMEYVAILVPVLFVHELGHYLAMRAFRYRNLRMFFIPFFGAAVSGQHYNVPGWKKVIVSLMGPVPGILLGATIGGAGLLFHMPILVKVSLVTLILNGFNLLPILPLDGGWVYHALLFCRHYWLDTAFRIVAALGLMALGMYSQSKITMYLGIPMLLSIPLAYKNARIAWELRHRGVPEASADDQTVPAETAHAIISEVKKTMPGKHATRMVAERTLQIFETLNARPPGWAATIGLLFVHLTSLGMAVVFSVVFVIGQSGELRRIFRKSAAAEAQHPVHCNQLQTWTANPGVTNADNEQLTIVATFPKTSGAIRAFQLLTNRLPATATLHLFGDSLLLNLPAEDDAARKEWLADLQARTKNIFVDSADLQTRFNGTCVAANEAEAKAIAAELEAYFSPSDLTRLIPPWHPRDPRTPEERDRHFLARQTYVKMQAAGESGFYESKEFASIQKKIIKAQRQGDKAEARVLQQQLADLLEQNRKQRYERVLSGAEGPVETNTAALFMAYAESFSQTNSAREGLLNQLAAQMGALPPPPAGASAVAELNYSTQLGMVICKDNRLTFTWMTFHRVSLGAPAFIEWLCAKGCRDFKYDFGGSYWPGEAGSD